MYVDFKITCWERVNIPEEYETKVLNAVRSLEVTESNELYGIFGSVMDNNYELLLDTQEAMFPSENEGFPTIEVHSSDNALEDEIIWDNGRKEEE